jgi:alkyl hydroperoxide reductase subunit F
VAYCPHCDGPLFKGKDVAVIGGGNSGVEAAIDLAGVVPRHGDRVRRPAQGRRRAGEQAAQPAQRDGAHQRPDHRDHRRRQKVNGLRYKDRATGEEHLVDLAGVFVQIGLVPNTEWLKGTLELSKFGEIVIDAKGATSVPGVFAAGDATTVPLQADRDRGRRAGAKAALSAFDHLIRVVSFRGSGAPSRPSWRAVWP